MNTAKKFHVKKGDIVKILSGNSKGKQGKVLEVYRSKYRAIVEGVNMVSKHIKPSAERPDGGFEQTEASIHLSNLMVIDPASGKAARTGRRLNSEGKLERYFKTRK